MDIGDFQGIGEVLRRQYGIDGTAGDAQDVEHPYIAIAPHEYCALCGLAPVTSKHVALPADMLADLDELKAAVAAVPAAATRRAEIASAKLMLAALDQPGDQEGTTP